MSSPVAVGQTLGHYRIVEKLGAGGMGVVFKASDEHLNRPVAIKVLAASAASAASDGERRARFQREARAASALNHPNIVQIYDIAEDRGIGFIAMEYVDGKTLDQAIPRHGMRVDQALKIAVQIADAMSAAHAAGILHRDLKPANIVVTAGGLAKVLDFGLAKLWEPESRGGADETRTVVTEDGRILGTVAYMSPEQAEGRPVDARSDIFSFGCVLYEMLTGVRPFRGESTVATLSAVLHQDPQKLREAAGADVPPELERIVLRCLRKDPARRFQGMADLKVALEELKLESDSGALGTPVSARPHRRNVAAWIAAGAVALVLVGGGTWLARRSRTVEERTAAPTPLTSYAGIVNWPDFSPDGKTVAFSWNGEKQDNFDIYIKLLGPGPPLRLTTDPGFDVSPAWSPDGSQIAFVRRLEGVRAAVLVVPALGGRERLIAEGMIASRIAWSRDGRFIIVARRDAPDGGAGLFALSVTGGETKRLTTPPAELWAGDVWPVMSPDGHSLAFVRALTRSNSEIYVLPLGDNLVPAGEPRQLTHENSASSGPAWTPDGQRVVFSSGGMGAATIPRLMVIAASGSQQRAEPVPGGDDGEAPAISSTGALAYIRSVRDENIWSLALGGDNSAPQQFIASTRRDVEPRFSPDGKWIAFSSDRSGSNQVWVCDSNGRNESQITNLGGTMTSGARWAPDGNRLVFVSNQDGQMEIYTTTINGGAPARLTNHPGHDSAPYWSRDGKWIYFASNREDGFQLWKMPPVPGAAPVRVTRHGGYAAVESVDGKTLIYAKRGEHSLWSIWKRPVDGGGEETEIIPSISAWGDFDVAAKGVYYIDSAAAGARLRLLRFGGGDAPLFTLPKRTSFGVTVAPDESRVLYTQFDQDATELMLLEGFARK